MKTTIIGKTWENEIKLYVYGNVNQPEKVIITDTLIRDMTTYTITAVETPLDCQEDTQFYILTKNGDDTIAYITHWYGIGEWIVCGLNGEKETINSNYLQAIADYLANI